MIIVMMKAIIKQRVVLCRVAKNKEERLKRSYEIKEIRAIDPQEGEPKAVVEGLAIVYETETNVGNWFKEIIKRGALDGADLKDVPLFIHHNSRDIPLARSRNNNNNSTLQLNITEQGLRFRAELDTENNTDARALYSSIKRGDISGMSFAFSVKDEKWLNLESDLPTREIYKFSKIYEISALWSPQYEETNIMAAREDALNSVDKLALDSAKSQALDSVNLRKKLIMQTYF